MKIYHKIGVTALFLAIFLVSFSAAHAATPSVTLTNIGTTNINAVQVTVYGDAYYPVQLYYRNGANYSQFAGTLGTTNASGYFLITLNGNAYNIPPGALVYVIVNNQQSQLVAWPYYNSNNGGGVMYPVPGLILNSAQLNFTTGQTFTIRPQNYVSSLYISNNSNSYVANVSVYNNQITITANNAGSTNVVICGANMQCATIYITVQASYYQSYNQYPTYPTYPSVYSQPVYQQPVYQYVPPITYYPTQSTQYYPSYYDQTYYVAPNTYYSY